MCTGLGLCYKKQYFIGKNHDWISKYASIVINPRGMVNHDTQFIRKDEQLNWVSKYGSITVNNVAENSIVTPAAMVGMNEKGLSVLTLWLEQSKYPDVSTKAVVPTELWAKYFLDNAATVDAAIQLAKNFDVKPSTLENTDVLRIAKTIGISPDTLGDIKVHLFLQDKNGNSATMEYLNGKLVVNSGKKIPILAITNDAYCESIEYMKQFKQFGGKVDLPGSFDSLPRFARAAYALKSMPRVESKQQAISFAFVALAYSQNPIPNTQWSAVFDLSDKALYLRSIDNQQIRIVRLDKFNISKGNKIKHLSINNNLSGYVESKFKVLKQQL
jgi:penicillin V acylase-like amidase (Ntn superfamily)